MKKSKKIILTILPVLMILAAMFVTFAPAVFADNAASNNKVSTDFPTYNDASNTVTNLGSNIWGTVVLVVRILAFAAIVFAGVRYMFASADQKADIKKGLVYLVLGAVLVFASTYLVNFIVNITKEIAPPELGETTTPSASIVRNIDEIA